VLSAGIGVNTWSDAFTIFCIAVSFFFAGRLWQMETQWRDEERRNARRRANRLIINNRKETR
jgi:hypothetical protein